MESKCHNHWQGVHVHKVAVGQLDAPFHFAKRQYPAPVHGSDGGTECRGNYIEKLHQLHFAHPNIGGIGRYGNPAVPVHRDCCPFHTLCGLYGETSVYLALESGYVVFKFLVRHLRVNLRCGDIGMPQNLAHAFYRHTVIESQDSEGVAAQVE